MNERERKKHFSRVAALPCIVCQTTPVTISHSHGPSMKARGVHRAMSRKPSDFLVLPICHDHHLGENGLDRIGVGTWERRYGEQAAMLDKLGRMLELDLWALAAADTESTPRPKRAKPKVMAHVRAIDHAGNLGPLKSHEIRKVTPSRPLQSRPLRRKP